MTDSSAWIGSFLEEEALKLRLRVQKATSFFALLLIPAALVQMIWWPAPGAASMMFAAGGVVLPFFLDQVKRPWSTTVFVASIPTFYIATVHASEGALAAAHSHLLELLFAFVMALAMLHLSARLVIVAGIVGCAVYSAYYGLLLWPALRFTGAVADELASPASQVPRIFTLLGFMAFAALLVPVVRDAAIKAAKRAREHELFAKYRLDRVVGNGGMGTVWAARYCPEGGFVRPVAVKLVHDTLAQRRPDLVAAFRREAEVSARLLHENIVQVLDFGKDGDRWFLAMEFVDGLTLGQLLSQLRQRQRILDPALAAWIAREIAQGIAYAHDDAVDFSGRRLGVVHRDLAPSNVMLSRSGQVKVSDFGVAWLLESDPEHTNARGLRGLVGHQAYWSPEQARGGAVDERSDLFAIGIVFWEMLTGTNLFRGRAHGAEARRRWSVQARAPSSLREELAGGPWDAFTRRALALQPELRFQSAREMIEALDVILDEVGVPDERALAVVVDGVLNGAVPDVARMAERTVVVTSAAPPPAPATGAVAAAAATPASVDDESSVETTTANAHRPRPAALGDGADGIHERPTMCPPAEASRAA